MAITAELLNNAAVPLPQREELGRALANLNSESGRRLLSESLRIAPYRLQLKLAQMLSGSAEGADALLSMVTEGRIPPQLLADRVLKDKLVAARPASAARVAQLTAGLKPMSERLQNMIDELRAGFLTTKAQAEAGAKTFAQNCAACHSMEGKGGVLGPQLDGVGHRGLERLCEDILDPNRNVDAVFRYSIVTLKSGEILSGLFRREEGDLLVFADPTGKEVTVPKSSIQERRESETSLMPEIFGDSLPPADFYNLLTFLLSKSGTQAQP
jgi:putative heme-binding domain-containing protein